MEDTQDLILTLATQHEATFGPEFTGWLHFNLHVWEAFEREALRVWRRGRRHYSARTIMEVLRHESALAEDGDGWKLNNTTFPDLARLFLLAHPSMAGLFEIRETRQRAGRSAEAVPA